MEFNHMLWNSYCCTRVTSIFASRKERLQQERSLIMSFVSPVCLLTLQDVSLLPELQILDVSNNQLKSVTGLSSLQHLEDLWLNDNQIVELEDVNTELDKSRSTLTCVYLSCNPATRNNPLYKQCMLRWLPNLQQLDADYVRGAP